MSDPAPAARPRALPLPDIIAALLLAAHAVLAWLARAPGIETSHDDARYLLLGRALRAFSYRDIWRVDAPPHTLYPPGYPAALALVSSVFGERVDVLLAFTIAASVAALLVAYLAVRRLEGGWAGVLALVPLAGNPFLLERAGGLASEPLFMALSLGALLVLLGTQPTTRRLVLAGALAIAAALTRSIGAALLIAVLADWALAGRRRAAAVLLVAAALTVGAWFAWTARAQEKFVGENYVADAGARHGKAPPPRFVLLHRLARNVPAYLTRTVPTALAAPSIPGRRWDNVLVVGFLGLGLAAGFVQLWRRWRPAALYGLVTAGILAAWPWVQARFLLPLVPLFWAMLVLGVLALAGTGRRRAGMAVLVVFAVGFAAAGAVPTSVLERKMAACVRGPEPPDASCLTTRQGSFLRAVAYIRDSVPPSEPVLAAKAATVAYFAGRPSAGFRAIAGADPEHFVTHLEENGVRRILLATVVTTERDILAPRLYANCGALTVERAYEPGTLLLRVRGTADSAAADACAALQEWRRGSAAADTAVYRGF